MLAVEDAIKRGTRVPFDCIHVERDVLVSEGYLDVDGTVASASDLRKKFAEKEEKRWTRRYRAEMVKKKRIRSM